MRAARLKKIIDHMKTRASLLRECASPLVAEDITELEERIALYQDVWYQVTHSRHPFWHS